MKARDGGVRERTVALAVMASAMGIMVACATSPALESRPAAEGLVRDVRVDQSVDGRIITLIGLENVDYKSFATSQPDAVVVDFTGVRVDGNATRIPVYDGMVDQISLAPYEDESGQVMTRLEVTTGQLVDFEVFEAADGLALRLRPRSPESADTGSPNASTAADPWAYSGPGSDGSSSSTDEDSSFEAVGAMGENVAELPAAGPATRLTDVRVQVFEDGVLFHFAADGAIGVTERFALTNPDRFVVDLPGLTTDLGGKSFPVDSDRVTQIRVGSHGGKIRVVIDGGPEADGFAGRRILPSRDGLFVGLGGGADLSVAMSKGVQDADAEARRLYAAASQPAVVIASDLDREEAQLAEASAEEQAPELVPAPVAAFAEAPELDTSKELVEESSAELADQPAELDEAVELAESPETADAQSGADSELASDNAIETAEAEPDDATQIDEAMDIASNEGETIAAASPEAVDEIEQTEQAEATELAASEPSADTDAGQADAIGAEEAVAAAAELVSAPQASEAAPLVRIYGVNYDSQSALERIVVLSDSVAHYDIHTPDSETLVVSIHGAVIAPEAEGRILAKPGAPISLITTFQQPETEQAEVRIVVKRAPDLMPAVTRRGTMIFIDFPNNGEVAAAPPAFDAAPVLVAEIANDAALEISASPQAEQSEAETSLSPVAQAEPSAAQEPEAPAHALAEEAPADPWQDEPLEALPASRGEALAEAVPATPVVQPVASVAPPAAVEILKEGGLIDGKEYAGRRISLDFNDVPVEDVLRLIAEVSDLNVIAGDEVKGNITIRMMDVPWDQALDIVLLTKGLGFIRIGNVLRIAPSDVLKAEAELRLQERRNLEKLEDLIVKLLPINYADVKDASNLVQRLLTERGSVIEDQRTSTLIIKDIPSVVDEAVALVQAIDTQTPQVLIEAKIVEASLDFSRELGTVWSVATQPLQDGFDSGSDPRTDLGGQDFKFYGDNSLSFNNPIKSIRTATGTLSAFLLDEKLNLQVQLQAQESNGEGKVISSPRIVTMDNREAEIEQGVSIPFQTFEQGDAKLEFIDAVLSLKVTPHITADRSIIMKLEVTRNAPDSSIETPTGSPAIAKNVARTETLVGDGQTLVLGGIYTITKTATYSQVPYLHRIPILGNAFKSKRLSDARKELLIFVTPRIMADVTSK